MTLSAARTELIDVLRNRMGWEYEITTEYQAYSGLPVIIVEVGDFVAYTNQQQTAGQYELAVEMRLPIDATEAAEKHRDIAQNDSMAGVLSRASTLPTPLRCSAIIVTSVEVGVEDEVLQDGGSRSLYIYVNAACELYPLPLEDVVLPADAIPPTLDADLADVWGITIAGDILHLAEGTPRTAEESDIHSYDLTTNTRLTSEITAGITSTQYHRGIDNDGVNLYLVDDDGSRGSWVLNKIEIATNTLLATLDLGAGTHTACVVSGTNREFVSVAVDRGGTTDFRVFNAADLSVAADAAFSENFGEVAGAIWIAGYAYDVVGSTAICTTDDGRRGDLDINLGGFRVQWHDLARRNSYLWVSGTQDNADGTATGIIRAFKLPPEVIRAAG